MSTQEEVSMETVRSNGQNVLGNESDSAITVAREALPGTFTEMGRESQAQVWCSDSPQSAVGTAYGIARQHDDRFVENYPIIVGRLIIRQIEGGSPERFLDRLQSLTGHHG